MSRLTRTLVALMFGGSLLMAQLPNPLNLPDPLGLSKKPAPSQPAPREGRRLERKPKRDKHADHGKHKGQEKHEDKERGKQKGKH